VITELEIEIPAPVGVSSWGQAFTNHPMRAITRAVASDPDGWTPERRDEVVKLFDSLAPNWNERDLPERKIAVSDAIARGLAHTPSLPGGVALELGSGTGLNRDVLEDQFETVVSLDISTRMLARLPSGAIGVRGDGSCLPLCAGSINALVLINMFLFPPEADRVLSPEGVVIWVNSRGSETPIYLAADEVDAALPGNWDGVSSTAGFGTWSVHWRA